LSAFFTFSAFAGDPTIDPPERIEVHGSRMASGSWSIVCRGIECKTGADSVADMVRSMLDKAAMTYQEQEKVQKSVCAVMLNKKHAECWKFQTSGDLFGQNPALWAFPAMTNGCGAGSLGEAIAAKVATGTHGFTGNLDQPLPGVSFLNACNNHDICYGSQVGKSSCDDAFYRNMTAVCGSDSQCGDFAYAYRGAVGVGGEKAYKEAGLVKQCKNFSDDYKRNCSNTNGGNGT